MENQKTWEINLFLPYFINALGLAILIFLIGTFPINDFGGLILLFVLIIVYSLIGGFIFFFIANYGYFNPWKSKLRSKETTGAWSEKLEVVAYQFSKYFILFWPALYAVENTIEKEYTDLEHKGLLTELFGDWTPKTDKKEK